MQTSESLGERPVDDLPLLTTGEVASFVSRGFLRLDCAVPDDINAQAMDQLPAMFRGWLNEFRAMLGAQDAENDGVPLPRSGTSLAEAYEPDSAFGRMVRVPRIAGAIASLVGVNPASTIISFT